MQRFRHSPIKRAKRRGLLRNVCVALGNIGDPVAVPALVQRAGRRRATGARTRRLGARAHRRLRGACSVVESALEREQAATVLQELRYALTLLDA